MFETGFSKFSELAFDQDRSITNVKENKNLGRNMFECHVIILICTIIYGAVLGVYAKGPQIFINALKIPLLFLITLYIVIPIIFIIDKLLGNKINFSQISTLLLLGFSSTAIVLIAFSPLMLFFILTALDYYFIVILNIVICGFAGYFGIISILTSFKKFHNTDELNPSLAIGSLVIVFVGTQLAWTLRPFFHTTSEFTRPISGNFYVALASLMEQNPIMTVVLFGVFGLIAVIITGTRLIMSMQPRQVTTVTGPSRPRTMRKVKNKNHPAQTPYHPYYYPSSVWGVPYPMPQNANANANAYSNANEK